MRRLTVLFLLAFFITSHAQEPEKVELIGDRPDQTESAFLIPQGYFQFEDGFISETENTDIKNISFSSMLLRYGLFDHLELRFGSDYIKTVQQGMDDISGFAPVFIGAKIHVQEEKGWVPQIAFLGHITLSNTGSSNYLQTMHSANMILTFNHTLNESVSLGYSLGADFQTEHTVGTYTLVTGFALSDKIGAFLEVYGDFSKHVYPQNKINGGITYLVLPRLQLDFAGGFGLSQYAANSYFSFGFIYLFNLK
jgi:hypothetical protein